MVASLQEIQTLIDKGHKKQARKHLKQMLKDNPSADLWYLTALAVESDDDAIMCLRNALELDAFHTSANRLLHTLEGALPLHEQEKLRLQEEAKAKTESIKPLKKINRQMKKDRFQRQKERQRRRNRYGCLFSLLLSFSCSLFAFSAIGMLPGLIGTIAQFLGGVPPVYEIDGTPIEFRDDAPMVLTPALSDSASDQEVDIMDHGLLHEYNFRAIGGKSYAIYVQFMSLNANKVSRNVVIVDPDGYNATANCERQRILEGDNGIAFICDIRVTGEWSVRILGRTGESVGAYFVGVEVLDF